MQVSSNHKRCLKEEKLFGSYITSGACPGDSGRFAIDFAVPVSSALEHRFKAATTMETAPFDSKIMTSILN